MGGEKKYLAEGGFTEQTYRTVGVINGIKELEKINAGNGNTPLRSNTPYTMYAVRDSKSGQIKQVAVYGGKDGRQKLKDIDIGHDHTNKKGNGKTFYANEIHVHEYYDGNPHSEIARKPSKKERRLLMLARNRRPF